VQGRTSGPAGNLGSRQMDGCTRQNPAYRPATEEPREGLSPFTGRGGGVSEQLRDLRGGARGPVGLDRAIVDLAADLLGDRGGDRLRAVL
jgi:hypothetical protein